MPFDPISSVTNWTDFGFKFYEGSEEPQFMNVNNIMNFPYVEPPMEHYSLPSDTVLDDVGVMGAIDDCLATESTHTDDFG